MNAPAAANDGMGCLVTGGTARFRVWAPSASQVRLEGDFTNWGTNPIAMGSEGSSGNWSVDGVSAAPGQMYKYIITTNGVSFERTDARALQVRSSNAASAGYVVDNFPAVRQPFTTPPFQDFLIYQLHVGSFSGRNDGVPVRNNTATFLDLIDKLDYIRGLGFNAIALLPITDAFADVGGAGEGYGPSDMFASEDAYSSSPEKAVAELIQLIDAAHSKGLAIILDVVYNHGAQIDNRYWDYDGNTDGGGIYFIDGHDTQFGNGFAMWRREIKDFFLDNARLYLGDYRADGLRFDAVQYIQPDAVATIVQGLRSQFPDKYLIAEYNPDDPESAAGPVDPFGNLGFCATWDLNSPGQLIGCLNGSDVVNNLLRRIGNFSDPNQWHQLAYLTGSHDQIFIGQQGLYFTQRFGGRFNGWARAKARLAWAFNATLAATPMLFMGTEGHIDTFWSPSLNDDDHRIDWLQVGDGIGAPMQQMVRDINQLRWNYSALRSAGGVVVHIDCQNQVVGFKRYDMKGDVLLVVVNVGNGVWSAGDYGVNLLGDSGNWEEIFNSQAPVYGGIETVGNFGGPRGTSNGSLWINLPSWCVLVFQKL